MTAIPGPSATNRISSHPVSGFKFVECESEAHPAQQTEPFESGSFFQRVAGQITKRGAANESGRGVEIASVAGSLAVGLLFISGAAAIFGKVLLVGIQYLVG